MNLKDFAQVYYNKYRKTAAFNSYITVRTFTDNRHLWEGRICDLYNAIPSCPKLNQWIIVEMVVDHNHKGEENIPDYNKAKILKVI